MKVTVITPTYGRIPHDYIMLNELVYWFGQQTYEDKELIIVNDAKNQTLLCHAPDVHIINLSRKFDTLGEKYEYARDLANGEIVIPCDDDDIMLPNHLSTIVENLQGYEYFYPQGGWFQTRVGDIYPRSLNNVFHNCSGYRKDIGVHYEAISGPQDMAFETKALRESKVSPKRLTLAEYTHVYRWQMGTGYQPNLSGNPNAKDAYDNRPSPVSGTYVIVPERNEDYVHLRNTYVQSNR